MAATSHLKALLNKNWILWKRSWCISLLEILIPVTFSFFLILLREKSSPTSVPSTTYYNQTFFSFSYDSDLNPLYFKNCKDKESGGMVAIVPDPSTDTLAFDINQALQNAGFTTKSFNTNQEIDDYTAQPDYDTFAPTGKTLCFAVVLNKNNENNQYEYMLRFNVTNYGDSELPNPGNNRVQTLSFQDISTMTRYGYSGFLSLQNFIDNLILQKETGKADAKISSTVTSRTVEAYTIDDFSANLQGQMSMFIAFPLLLPSLRFMNGILTEKEKKIREGMKIMGLRNSAFFLSWFITYFIIFTIISFLTSAALTKVFELSSFGLIFLWHWEFSMTLMALSFLLTTFFSKAKVGNVAGFVVPLFLNFFKSLVDTESSSAAHFIVSFVPQASISFAADQILGFEATRIGLTADTVGLTVNNYKAIYHFIVMAIDFVLFILLGSYFDQVLPSEFGIRKHPLFCLTP